MMMKMKKTALTSFMILCLLSTILLMALGFNIQPVKAGETIYIRADGSVDPPTANITSADNITYYFTDDNHDSILVERNKIVIDGAGYSVLGTEPFFHSKGIDLAGRKNVTLTNMSIGGFYYGIYLNRSSNNDIFGNIMANNECGIRLDHSTNNSISRNKITANNGGGIFLWYSSNNRVSGNNVTNNGEGIYLPHSFDNSISGNDVTNNMAGIILVYSSINSISGNNIIANGDGIPIHSSSSNTIFGNDLVANSDGIFLDDSTGNIIYHNNFLNNTRQVYDFSWDPPPVPPSRNTWDWGYPSGGNYWSDYAGNDTYSGPYQNETSYDWIGDAPYVIDENNQDNYPLMNPYAPETEEVRITYRKLLGKYNELLADYDKLNSTYYTLSSNYAGLQGDYDALNSSYNDLNATYNELKSDQEATLRKLNNTRDLMYGFMATAIAFIVTTVYFAIRKPKTEPRKKPPFSS